MISTRFHVKMLKFYMMTLFIVSIIIIIILFQDKNVGYKMQIKLSIYVQSHASIICIINKMIYREKS